MTFRPSLSLKACLFGAIVALVVQGCATPVAPQATAAAQYQQPSFEGLAALEYSGSQQAVANLQQAIADAGQDTPRLAAIEAQLVNLLGRADATYAGRQAICENLGRLYAISFAHGEHPVPPVLVSMLADGTQVDLARAALERAQGATVDTVFLSGLGQSTGRVRVALIQSLGNRGVTAAVPALGALLEDPDSAASAAKALGQIGSLEAAEALSRASNPLSPSVIEARIACARKLGAADSVKALQELADNPSVARPLRTSAFSGLLALDPSGAPDRVAAALAGSDLSLKQSAATWIVKLPPSSLMPVIGAHFSSFDPLTQEGVIAAFGRVGEPSTLPLVLESARSDQPALRRAAIVSLGELPGNAEVAQLLAKSVRTTGEEGSAAKLSLSKLRGPGVDEVVLTGARQAENPLRTVFLEELALRDAPGAADLFMAIRAEANVPLRCVALDGLALVASADLETALLDWLVTSTDSTEQTHAIRAASSSAFRNPDEKARLKPIADLVGKSSPAVQRRLLTTLSRIGGSEAAGYVARYALQAEEPQAESALVALGHWNDKTGLDPLATVAEKTQNPALRSSAVENTISLLPQNNWELKKDDRAIIARLRAVTKDAAVIKRLDDLENPPKK